MDKKSSEGNKPRIPEAVGAIQVNFCKMPTCPNYGVPASLRKQPHGPGAGSRERDAYTVVGSAKHVPVLKCHHCGEYPPIKSNQGIHEELYRMSAHFEPKAEASCPDGTCNNHGVGIIAGMLHYQSFGKTKSGSRRYRCRTCGKTFAVGSTTVRQKQPDKNKVVFKLLLNKTPFQRICEVADIRMGTVYAKLDFFHRQLLAFTASREHKLLDGIPIRRLYIAVDRQDYVVNWSNKTDKRNIILHAVGSADNDTRYVFGVHLNFDSSLDPNEIEQQAIVNGDYDPPHPFRRYARVWLSRDYADALGKRSERKPGNSAATLNGKISAIYAEAMTRKDIEAFERLNGAIRLPSSGMQVHAEYSLYGHFFFLKNLFGGVEKIRFFLDQDSGMRAACLSAFQPEIKARRCDAFYVHINKDMTVDEKRKALSASREEFRQTQRAHPGKSENEVKLLIIKQRMQEMAGIGRWKDRWLTHPFPNMGEPEKAVCYLTDYGDYDQDHMAWLYNKASMHAIDCFFMQIRRRISLLERAIVTASSARRMWYGYSAYKPENIVKLLDVFRVFYNYCLAGKGGKTPAMRLGLAKEVVTLEDLIYS